MPELIDCPICKRKIRKGSKHHYLVCVGAEVIATTKTKESKFVEVAIPKGTVFKMVKINPGMPVAYSEELDIVISQSRLQSDEGIKTFQGSEDSIK